MPLAKLFGREDAEPLGLYRFRPVDGRDDRPPGPGRLRALAAPGALRALGPAGVPPREASIVLDELGLSMSGAMNIFLRAVIREGGLPFGVRLGSAGKADGEGGDRDGRG